ncbi:MAG: FtsX-like permease family protein [Oscillospiraceae bacterium]|jgi:putative ABC transport system permease protein|nr:FtsX-like permease family protein [Oscillospiraceae bacterium]
MLTRKMLRDMGRHKTQFVSIFLMAFLAVFIYSGVGGEWRGLSASSGDFYAATRLADAWIYGEGFTDEQARAVLNIPGVRDVERRLELDAEVQFPGAPRLSLRFAERNEISAMYLTEGKPFDVSDAEGIWLAKRFADARGISPGDAIELTARGVGMTKTVRGLIYSPEHVFFSDADAMTPDFAAVGFAYLAVSAFPVPQMFTYSTMLVSADIGAAGGAGALESDISAALGGGYTLFLEQSRHPSVAMFSNEVAQHRMMGDIFPVAFLLIALLTMLTTMTRIVTNQRVQIGALRALGFKKSVILRHYVSYGLFLSLAGSALGIFTGPLVLPPLFYPSMSGFYTLPEWRPAYHASFAAVAAATAGLGALVTLAAVSRLLRETPADALRPRAPKVFRHRLIERSRMWNRFGFNARWNYRDASRNKTRSLMAVIGVLGCTALVVCALGMNDSMELLKKWQYGLINKYESKLILTDSATPEEIENVVAAFGGEALMEQSVELRSEGGARRSGALTVRDGTALLAATDAKLRPMSLPNGIALTAKMADLLGVAAGDELEWRVYGDSAWQKGIIEALCREPAAQGMTVSREHYESQGFAFSPTSVLSADIVDAGAVIPGVASVALSSEGAEGWDDLTEAMYIMVYLLIAAAAVLSVVVLYNLGLLSFTEMERELATLKVLGFKSGRLRELLLTQNLWFSAVGFLLGVPCGLELIHVIVAFSGDSYDFPIKLTAPTLAVSFVFTFGLSALVNLLFSRKIRGLSMVESLKSAE